MNVKLEGVATFVKDNKKVQKAAKGTGKTMDDVSKKGDKNKNKQKDQKDATDKNAKSFRNLNQVLRGVGQGMGFANLAIAGLTIAITAGLTRALTGTIRSATEFEASFTGIRKTTDASEAQFGLLAAQIRSLALDVPLSTSALNELGETAGQLGIRAENLREFVETMAQLGATTNIVGQQGATSLARFMNIMGSSQGMVEQLANQLVELGNNTATTESEILNFSLRIAGAGRQVGLTEGEVLAFAAALSSVGVKAEAGGSAISRTFITIRNAVDDAGEDLEVFAKVAGVSAAEYARAFEDDAANATLAFIEGLARMETSGLNTSKILKEVSLNELRVSDALRRATNASGEFRRAQELQNTALEEGNALQEEFGKRMETTAAQAQLARNAVSDLAIDVGQKLVNAFAGLLDPIIEARREIAAARVTAAGLVVLMDELGIGSRALAGDVGVMDMALTDSVQGLEDVQAAIHQGAIQTGFFDGALVLFRQEIIKDNDAINDSTIAFRAWKEAAEEAGFVFKDEADAIEQFSKVIDAQLERVERQIKLDELKAEFGLLAAQATNQEQFASEAFTGALHDQQDAEIISISIKEELEKAIEEVTEAQEDEIKTIDKGAKILEKYAEDNLILQGVLEDLRVVGTDPVEESFRFVFDAMVAAGVGVLDMIPILAALRLEMNAVEVSAVDAAIAVANIPGFEFSASDVIRGSTQRVDAAQRFERDPRKRLGDPLAQARAEAELRATLRGIGFGGEEDEEETGGTEGLTAEEIAAAREELERWIPLNEAVLQAQRDLDEALEEDFHLRQAITDLMEEEEAIAEQIKDLKDEDSTFSVEILRLEGEREKINEQIVALKSRESEFNQRILELEGRREDLADRMRGIRNAEFSTEQALLAIQQQRKGILQQISDLSAPEVAEVERITDQERLLNIAREELELAALLAEERGEDTEELEDAVKALAEEQALEREILGTEKELARLRIDGIEDAREEELAAVALETEARASAFEAEKEARSAQLAALQEESRVIGEQIEAQQQERDAEIRGLEEQRVLIDDRIEIQQEERDAQVKALEDLAELNAIALEEAEKAFDKEIERRDEVLQKAKDELKIEESISELIRLREEKSISNLKTMITLQETLNRLRDQDVGTIVDGSPAGRADGGPFASGQLLKVGERGPELAVFNSPGNIISNEMLASAARSIVPSGKAASGGSAPFAVPPPTVVGVPIETRSFNFSASYLGNPRPDRTRADVETMLILSGM